MVIGILVTVEYHWGIKSDDIDVTDTFPVTSESQQAEVTEKIARNLCARLAERTGYADETGKLLEDLIVFQNVSIHNKEKGVLYCMKIQYVDKARQ
jgi:hypothetical protein